MAKASGVALHDFGTTFKAYRAEILKDINLYGELHRFIPALASFYGARIAEVPIQNIPPRIGRLALRPGPHDARHVRHRHDQVPAELLHPADALLRESRSGWERLPAAHPGLPGWCTRSLTGHDIVIEHGPLMLAGGLLLLAGLMMFTTGLLGEVLIRTYFESQGRRIYAIREIRCRRERRVQGEAR